MSAAARVTAKDVDRALRDKDVLGLRVIHFGFAGGVLIFLGVVAALQFTGGERGPPRPGGFLTGLSVMHAVLAVSAFGMSFALVPLLLKPQNVEKLAERQGREPEALMYVGTIRGAWIARLALQEGAALFGMVVCLLAVLDGASPLYWLNALSALPFFVTAVMTLPSRERVLATFEERFSRRA